MTMETVYFYNDDEAIKKVLEKPEYEHIKKIELVADEGKTLTNGARQQKRAICNEDEVSNWQEIELPPEPKNDDEEISL